MRYRVLLIFGSLIIPIFYSFGVGTSSSSSPSQSMVIYPLLEGEEARKRIILQLKQVIEEETPLQVVAPEKVEAILNYHHTQKLEKNQTDLDFLKECLHQAKEHYFQLAYRTAEGEFNEIIKTFEVNPDLLLEGGPILLESWISLGLLKAANKKREAAIQAFFKVLELNPYYVLDPKGYAPSIRKLFSQARESIPVERGEVRLDLQPKVTEVYLNGIYQGVSPLTLTSLPPGAYALRFKANHYTTIDRHLFLKPNQKEEIRAKLEWIRPNTLEPPHLVAVKQSPRQSMEQGVRIAQLLKVDHVLLLEEKGGETFVRLLNGKYRASHKPFVFRKRLPSIAEEDLRQLGRLIYAQTELDILKDPHATLDPEGLGDPILLGPRKKTISKKILWGGIGAVSVGGIIAGILAVSDGPEPTKGGISLSFK